ncbi:histidine kinase [Pseudonocardia sp.]|uniref:sensor histidine kinase n=1 Tax=Pseudonocardia sp. TaxID=60912 RepID=UPI0031FC3CFF
MHEHHLTVLDAAVPAVVGAVIVVGQALHGGASAGPVPLVLGVAAAVALTARRRWPGWTLVASGVLVAVLFHLDRTAASVAVLAPAVALYSVALRRGRLEQAAAGIVALAAVIAADLSHPGRPTLGQTIAHVLLIALPLLAADVIRTHRANMRLHIERFELAEQAREQDAERRAEQERVRIARELHDVVAHTLTEINVTAAAAAERAGEGDERAALEQIERASHAAIGELRAVLGVLRGPTPGTAPHAPTPGIDDIADMIIRARGAGLDVHLDVAGARPERISDSISLAAYRIVQESLTNVRRHASGARAGVTLRFSPAGVTVTVDNEAGTGTGTGNDTGTGGVGITGMRERATAVGGRLSAGPRACGFRVDADLPYEPTR